MKNLSLHRYATRPGFYFTEDGGADAIVRSETAEQVWLSIIEPVDKPSAFFSQAIRLFADSPVPFHEQIHMYPVCTRIIESLYCRETLFKMEGPNYGLWYVHIPKAWSGMKYGYRVDGQWDPKHGVRFNPYKILLDPYGKGVDGKLELTDAAFSYDCTVADNEVHGNVFGAMSTVDSLGHTPLSVAIDDRDVTKHDADPTHPHIPWSKTVIYELHVKGFTKLAPWLPEELRGTYAGLAHPTTLAYLQGLGVTSIELLPIMAKQDEVFLESRGRTNYWGYNTLSYFSPEPSYATKAAQEAGPEAVRHEVIEMVRALHAAGFEVIMDVVYNHTCEGGMGGPTVCWRGLDNISYYRRDKNNIGKMIDTTGCGNTLDFTNTHVVTFAIDSLRYWAKRIGIDGFRFDLAVSLGRLEGEFTRHHPFLYALRSDLILGNLKLIMEPWDLGNQGWRTGQFGLPFGEWNDFFRDSTRKFWLVNAANAGRSNTPNKVGMQEMATRLCGSADLYATEPGRGAAASVNYITAHDGFTLRDLTEYNTKHNEANGEHNNDGSSNNNSYNFGVEGPSDDATIQTLRERASMNMLGTLLLSLGTPMLLAGDEFGHTQQGNNNAYCQDNELTWLPWDWMYQPHKTQEQKRLETVSKLVALRKSLDLFHQEGFFTRLTQIGLLKPSSRVQWFLPNGTTPLERDWFNADIRSFTMRLLSNSSFDVLIVINGSDMDMQYRMPSDCTWTPQWCSTEIIGIKPGHGQHVERISNVDDTLVWISAIPDNNEIKRVAEEVQTGKRSATMAGASAKRRAQQGPDGQNSHDNGETGATDASADLHATADNVWTIPAQSISLFKQNSY